MLLLINAIILFVENVLLIVLKQEEEFALHADVKYLRMMFRIFGLISERKLILI